MAITAFDGPVVTFPQGNTSSTTQSNPEAGPSIFHHGMALADPRAPLFAYVPGQSVGKQVSGWVSLNCQVIDQVPYTATVNNIAAAQTATAGTALTLVTASATGITAGAQVVRADTGALVTGLLAIDSAMTTIGFGSSNTIQIWDPTKAISRNIRIVCNGADQTGTFVVRGYDLYGQPMSETIAGVAATPATTVAVAGIKAFKYISSVTPAGTVNSTGVTVGTGDVIGLPLRADRFPELSVYLGNTAIAASTGFTAAVTSTATATSGDVRGTYGLQTSSNGVLRLSVYQSPQAANCSSVTGLLGVTQYTA